MTEMPENNDSTQVHTFTLEVSNKMGIHARPAAMIVRITSRYNGEIWIIKDGERINAKSIMGIMMLAAAKGTKLEFESTSDESTEFEKEMTELFSSKFQDEQIHQDKLLFTSRYNVGDTQIIKFFEPLLDMNWSSHRKNFLHQFLTFRESESATKRL